MPDEGSPDPIRRGVDTVRQTLIDVGGIIDGVAARVKDIVNETLKAIFEPLGAAIGAGTALVGELVTGLLNNLATVPDVVADGYMKWLELAEKDNGPGTALTRFILDHFSPEVKARIDANIKPPESSVLNVGSPENPAGPDIGRAYANFQSSPGAWKWLLDQFASFAIMLDFSKQIYSSEVSAFAQDVARREPVTPLSPDQLANAAVQTIVPQDWAAHEALRSGVTPELFDILYKITGMPPALEQMLSLLNRGVVDEAAVRLAIAQSHTKTEYTDALIKLRFAVPTPAEITHWLTRDAFIDAFVERYGMDAEYIDSKDKADPLFQKNAVDPDYIKYIWRAHWTLPSPGMAAEMFQRTNDAGEGDSKGLPSGAAIKSVIGQDDLNRLYRAAGYEPFWRDKLLKIAYNPLTRIDSRRMYLAGLIDDDRFYRAQLDIGYDAPTAQLILQWMQAQKAAAQRAQAEKHAAPLMTHMLDLYRRGLMGAPDVVAQADSLGIDKDETTLKLQVADLERTRDLAEKIRQGLHRLFVDGFVTEDEAANRAEAAGFTMAEWVRLRDEWQVEREFRTANDDEKRARELTKAQLIASYKDRLLGLDELTTHLRTMGYHDDEIAVWVALADYDETKRIADLRREAIHQDYVDEIIDVVSARASLAHLQLPGDHVEALLSRWTTEQRRREPHLTVQEVEKLFTNQLIDEGKARDLLHGLRYHDTEVGYLLQLWGFDVGITAERLAIQQQRIANQQQQFAERQQTAAQARAEANAQRVQAASAAAQRRADAATVAAQRREATAQETAARQQARFDKSAADAKARQDAAFAERDKLAQQVNEAKAAAQVATDARQQRTLQASVDRQQRQFDQADKLAQQRNTERINAEQRAQQFKIQAEDRANTRKQAAEARAQIYKVQAETRGEARSLRKEIRSLSAQRAREGRAQAARVAAEQRVAERQAALAQATATAQQQIATLRGTEGLPIQTQAEADFQDAATAARQRLAELGGTQ